MYYYGYGAGNCGTGCGMPQMGYAQQPMPAYPAYGSNTAAIVLVLFILLVIVIGTRFAA